VESRSVDVFPKFLQGESAKNSFDSFRVESWTTVSKAATRSSNGKSPETWVVKV
jgi:hypothetical protein